MGGPDSIDPEVARLHARAAATFAFARARDRGMEGGVSMARGSGIEGRKRVADGRWLEGGLGFEHEDHQDHQPHVERHTVRRQQSVRFAGPNAIRRERSIGTRAAREPVYHKQSSASLRPRALTNNVPVPAEFRPPSRSSSIGKASIRGTRPGSFVTTRAAYDEYYTKEDDIASTPSSYRRIRKSKSMMSPLRKLQGISFHNGTPESIYASDRSPVRSAHSRLLSAKSMSFLRSGRDNLTPSMRQNHDQGVQIARDRYLRDIEQQRLRAQPSFIFRSRSQREEKSFRKSVRSSSTNSWGLPAVSSASHAEQPTDNSLRKKARKASRSIKNKLKGLFKRTVSESAEKPSIPHQQLEARAPHGSHLPTGPAGIVDGDYKNIPLPDHATVLRVASRVPSTHDMASSQQLRSLAGSVRSIHSDGSGVSAKSRVTSWTSTQREDATVASTNSRHAMLLAEKERQRLSIIQENGTHVSSASLQKRPIPGQLSVFPSFHHPHPHSSTGRDDSSRSRPPIPQRPHIPPLAHAVDSQRVYSALMKRLNENSPKSKLALRMSSVESFGPPPPDRIPPRTSSRNSLNESFGIKSSTTATIRQVQEEKNRSSIISTYQNRALPMYGNGGHDGCSNHDDVFSPPPVIQDVRREGSLGNGMKDTSRVGHLKGKSTANLADAAISRKASYSAYPSTVMGDSKTFISNDLTPQELAQRNELNEQRTEGTDYSKPSHIPEGKRVVDRREAPQVPQRKILQQRGSGLFGTSFRTFNRTTSPYRRALANGDCSPVSAARVGPQTDGMSHKLISTTPLMSSKMADSTLLQIPTAYTESIYSRTSSGRTPPAAQSAVSLSLAEEHTPTNFINHDRSHQSNIDIGKNQGYITGDAVILVERATYAPRTPRNRISASATEEEFKSWMIKQVEGLEKKDGGRSNVDGLVNNSEPGCIASAVHHRSTSTNLAVSRVSSVGSARYVNMRDNYTDPIKPQDMDLAKGYGHRHVREYAQISDDDAGDMHKSESIQQPIDVIQQRQSSQSQCQYQKKPPPPPPLPPPQNFQLRPILKNKVSQPEIDMSPPTPLQFPIPPPPPIPNKSALRYSMSKTSLRSVKSTKSTRSDKSGASERSAVKLTKRNRDVSGMATPKIKLEPLTTIVNKKSNATIRSMDTPKKLVKKNQKLSGYEIPKTDSSDIHSMQPIYATPSPGCILAAAVERQFGSTGSRNVYSTPYSSCGYGGQENKSPSGNEVEDEHGIGDKEMDLYGVEGAGLFGPRPIGWEGAWDGSGRGNGGYGSAVRGGQTVTLDAQAMGSKRMVDLFLNSRRRRIQGSEDSVGGGAFI
jgi:hypothetical protein